MAVLSSAELEAYRRYLTDAEFHYAVFEYVRVNFPLVGVVTPPLVVEVEKLLKGLPSVAPLAYNYTFDEKE